MLAAIKNLYLKLPLKFKYWLPRCIDYYKDTFSFRGLKTIFTLVTFAPVSLFAQSKLKHVRIEGSGSPIVMLSGGTADMSALSITSKELSGNNKVIRMEHFNVQYATEGLQLPKDYSVQMESAAINYTLDSLNIKEQIIIIGHSYGGVIALDFALKHMNKVGTLILIEPPVFSLTKKQSPNGMQIMQALLEELTPQAKISEEHIERFRCVLLNCDTIDIRSHPQWQTWVRQKNRLRGLSVLNKYKVRTKQLAKFRKPVLIITGTQTVAFHKKIDEILTKEFPSAKELFLKGGHAIPTTAPLELAKAIREFIQ